MELTHEDSLRLHVLMANAQAIRIDENNMIVYGLCGDNESKVTLHCNCKSELYLKQVRELLSTIATGSPRGYPLFLKRWIRMGQMGNISPEKLLLLGEPEAVVAIAGIRDLSDDFARKAWWASPTAENARRMLQCPTLVTGSMGKMLAEFLVEYLPFETEAFYMQENVRLVLQADLISTETKQKIWNMGVRKKAYRLGFLHSHPDQLPEPAPNRADWESVQHILSSNQFDADPIAKLLLRLLSSPGQTYLLLCDDISKKLGDQDVVVSLMNAMGGYFEAARVDLPEWQDMETLQRSVDEWLMLRMDSVPTFANCWRLLPAWHEDLRAMLILAHLGEKVVWPVLSKTTAVGTLLRKKLEPVINEVMVQVQLLISAKQ